MESGRACQFDHPAEHVVSIQCFSWSSTGACSNGAQCKYVAGHININGPSAASSVAAVIAPAVNTAPAAPAPTTPARAAASSSAVVSAPAPSALTTTHAQPAKKPKRAREEKEEGNEDGVEKPSQEEDQESDSDGMEDIDSSPTPVATPHASPSKRATGNKKQRQQPSSTPNLTSENRFAGIAEAEEDSSPSTPTGRAAVPQSSLGSLFSSSPVRTSSKTRGQTTQASKTATAGGSRMKNTQ